LPSASYPPPVLLEPFNLVIRPAGSPCLAIRASEMRSRVLRVSFLAEDGEAFLKSLHEQGLAELEPGNVAVQIGRIFRARRARLPSYRYRRRQVLLRRQRRELVGLWRYHDNPGHRSDGL
jgi:hypothetical protein